MCQYCLIEVFEISLNQTILAPVKGNVYLSANVKMPSHNSDSENIV